MTLFGPALTPRASLENPSYPLTSTALVEMLDNNKVTAGVSVNEKSALGMPAVWRAVNLIASAAASLPLHAYRQGEGAPVRQATGAAADLLRKPHPDMPAFEVWETVFAHMLLWGNAYLWVGRDRLGRIVELWPIHPGRVRAGRTSEQGQKIYVVDGDTDNPRFDNTILHIPGFGYDGICGISPVRAARQGIGLALAAEEYGARLFGNGSLASGILQTDMRLDQAQADAIKKRWMAKQAGIKHAHEPIVLDSGAKFEQLTIPPADAQFLESRKFQIAEIARMFGVPPHMLMDAEKSTSWGTGIEQQSIGFVVYTLRPWLVRVEQRLSRLLNPQAVYARFTVEGLLRGDSAQRAAFYKSMWEIGALSSNEIRELEERDKVPGGDAYHRPLNFGELGTFDTTETPIEELANV